MDALCTECGSPLPPGGECWTRVHELLEIETRVLVGLEPELGMRTHFFAIASYQLQHPSRSTLPTLVVLIDEVASMIDHPRPMSALRNDVRRRLRGGSVSRKAAPDDRGHIPPEWPTRWQVTATDVIAAPDDQYVTQAARWAEVTIAPLLPLRGSFPPPG